MHIQFFLFFFQCLNSRINHGTSTSKFKCQQPLLKMEVYATYAVGFVLYFKKYVAIVLLLTKLKA